MNRLHRFFFKPYVAVGCVVLMYIFKVTGKISIGSWVNSPMILGDGFHNIADIFEILMVGVLIAIARLPATTSYPFGRKNVESIANICIALSLGFVAFQLIKNATYALLFATTSENGLLLGTVYAPWVFGITVCSAALSFLVGNYQIRVGKRSGHSSLVSDGEETLSDGMIEIGTVVGVTAEYFFQAPWLEHPLSIVIGALIARTASEIFLKGWHALLQHSIGASEEQEIRHIVQEVSGVVDISQLITFKVGNKAIIIMKIFTHCPPVTQTDMKIAIAEHILRKREEWDIHEMEFFIRFDVLPCSHWREACAVVHDHHQIIVAPNLKTATHLLICNVEGGNVVRWKIEMRPDLSALVSYLNEKQVRTVHTFFTLPEDTHLLETGSIQHLQTFSYLIEPLGL